MRINGIEYNTEYFHVVTAEWFEMTTDKIFIIKILKKVINLFFFLEQNFI